MADPTHEPHLDGFDRMTVALYRSHFFIAGLALLTYAGARYERDSLIKESAAWWIAAAAALGAWNLHLYSKHLRWLIVGFAWSGFLLASASPLLRDRVSDLAVFAGLGLHLAVLSALALKEQYCFRLPLMQIVPLTLAVGAICVAVDAWRGIVACFVLGGCLLLLAGFAKVLQPMGHDIGDRSRYDI